LLTFTLSNDSNPLSLYQSFIDASYFIKLRKEQNIFIDFSQFGDKVSALLDLCIANKEIDDQENRFICILTT
jgi:hypothetical protein